MDPQGVGAASALNTLFTQKRLSAQGWLPQTAFAAWLPLLSVLKTTNLRSGVEGGFCFSWCH